MENNKFKSVKINAVLIGFIWAIGISFILALILGIILHFTSLSSSLLPSFSALIFFLSILFGGTIGAKKAGNNGLFHGISVGIIYFAVSFMINTWVSQLDMTLIFFAKKLSYTLVAGALGGIIGVGLTDKD